MKVAVFGGTGFIGKELVKKIKHKGHEPLVLDIRKDLGWETKLSQCEAVVNLAGTPLFGQRWNDALKSEIHSSRVDGTKKIIAAVEKLQKAAKPFPKILINGSAIGYYGPSYDEDISEKDGPGADFLAFVCREWEEAALVAERKLGLRTVLIRTGVVLGKNGGALKQLLLPFKLGLGGPVGLLGNQWFSWIHMEDEVGIILHALETATLTGPLNATAPNPVRNKDFASTLGAVLHRPAILPLPGIALYAMVGEAAEMLVNGQKVLPEKTLASGYTFKYPKLKEALEEILK